MIILPEDALKEVFTPDVMASLRSHKNPSKRLEWRLQVLEASGPYPCDECLSYRIACLRAQKAAWEAYVAAAFACGMFEGEQGRDLRARLTGKGDDGFRGAMAECEVCWLLAGRMKLPVQPEASGRVGKNLEMRVVFANCDIGVEVKAPFRPIPRSPTGEYLPWNGDDADKIRQCLESANRQFTDNCRNILAIVPDLRTPMYDHRQDLLRAAYGESKITCPIDTATGGPAGPIEVKFFPEGKFLNTTTPGGADLKPDGFPAYRRISAVVCIEEEMKPCGSDLMWVDHRVLVLHNPYAYHPLSQVMFQEFPQLVPVWNEMQWTDGHQVSV